MFLHILYCQVNYKIPLKNTAVRCALSKSLSKTTPHRQAKMYLRHMSSYISNLRLVRLNAVPPPDRGRPAHAEIKKKLTDLLLIFYLLSKL